MVVSLTTDGGTPSLVVLLCITMPNRLFVQVCLNIQPCILCIFMHHWHTSKEHDCIASPLWQNLALSFATHGLSDFSYYVLTVTTHPVEGAKIMMDAHLEGTEHHGVDNARTAIDANQLVILREAQCGHVHHATSLCSPRVQKTFDVNSAQFCS